MMPPYRQQANSTEVQRSSTMDEYRDLAMGEDLERLAAEDDRGDAVAAMGGHDDEVTAFRNRGIDDRLVGMLMLNLDRLAFDACSLRCNRRLSRPADSISNSKLRGTLGCEVPFGYRYPAIRSCSTISSTLTREPRVNGMPPTRSPVYSLRSLVTMPRLRKSAIRKLRLPSFR